MTEQVRQSMIERFEKCARALYALGMLRHEWRGDSEVWSSLPLYNAIRKGDKMRMHTPCGIDSYKEPTRAQYDTEESYEWNHSYWAKEWEETVKRHRGCTPIVCRNMDNGEELKLVGR